MIRHLLKLTWNRKRANALLLVEISWLVPGAAALGTFALRLATRASRWAFGDGRLGGRACAQHDRRRPTAREGGRGP